MKELQLFPRSPLWRSDKWARKGTLDRLEKAANTVAEVAVLWNDVDMSIVGEAEDLIERIRAAHASVQEIWAARDQESDHV